MPIPTRPQRILVVVMRRLGDVLLATALIRSVRCAWPDARLEVLVNAGSAAVLDGNPDIDRLWVQPERARPRELWRLARQLFRRYDLAISALYNDRPHLWALVASAHRAGVVPPEGHPGARWKRWLCEAWTPLELGTIHTVEQYLRLADAIGIARVPEVVAPRAPSPPERLDGDYAVLHPAPLYRYKEWPVDGWRALVRGLLGRGLRVVFSAGPGARDRELVAAIVEGLAPDERARVLEPGPTRTLAELAPLIAGARVFVGPDTSITHLASATGTPTVALFGPSPTVEWGPWPARWSGRDGASPWQRKAPLQRRGNVWLVQGEGDCVPCHGEGCDRHPGSRSRCLDELAPERVLQVVEQALAQPRPAPA